MTDKKLLITPLTKPEKIIDDGVPEPLPNTHTLAACHPYRLITIKYCNDCQIAYILVWMCIGTG